jgi:protein-tyrosine phosphatase
MNQAISENLWWTIPKKLAGVRMPTPVELPELRSLGIGAIVSVFHDHSNIDLYQKANLPHLWLPIAVDSPPSMAQLERFIEFVEEQNQADQAVAVHCSTGRHRTGTLLVAYLLRQGVSYEQAMETVLTASSQSQLPTAQTQFLQSLAC